MRLLTKIYFEERLLAKIKEHAKAMRMSVSSFVSSIVADNLAKNIPGEVNSEDCEDKITIRLAGTEALMLRARAKKRGLSPTNYIRHCILYWNMREVQFYDSESDRILTEAIEKYDADIEALSDRIKNNMTEDENRALLREVLNNQNKLMLEYYDVSDKRFKRMRKIKRTLEDTIMREDFGDDWKEKYDLGHWYG